MCSFVYGVGEQLEGVHHLNVSTFLFPNQGSNHCNKSYTRLVNTTLNYVESEGFKVLLAWFAVCQDNITYLTAHGPYFSEAWNSELYSTLHRPPLLWANPYPVIWYIEDDEWMQGNRHAAGEPRGHDAGAGCVHTHTKNGRWAPKLDNTALVPIAKVRDFTKWLKENVLVAVTMYTSCFSDHDQ